MNKKEKDLLLKYDKDFIKIIDFYVFNCPVQDKDKCKVSQMSNTFEDRGIVGQKLSSLLKDIVKRINTVFLSKIYEYDTNNKTKYDMENTNKQLNKLVKNCNHTEYMYLYENSSYGKLKSIFYYLRCSIAHGDFIIDNNYIIGQTKKKDTINCKYKISIKTLITLIDIVENFNVKSKK